MVHNMRLKQEFFYDIEKNIKTIEVRLADEKRKQCHIGDIIVFSELPKCKRKISVVIDSIDYYNSFEELTANCNIFEFGIDECHISDFLNKLESIYSNDEVEKYGVLGIHFHTYR